MTANIVNLHSFVFIGCDTHRRVPQGLPISSRIVEEERDVFLLQESYKLLSCLLALAFPQPPLHYGVNSAFYPLVVPL